MKMLWHPPNPLRPKESFQEKQEVKLEAAVRGNVNRAVLTSVGFISSSQASGVTEQKVLFLLIRLLLGRKPFVFVQLFSCLLVLSKGFPGKHFPSRAEWDLKA